MTHPCPIPLPRYRREQLVVLDQIGEAYRARRISFGVATELRDLVRMGGVTRAIRLLSQRLERKAA